MAWNQVTNAVPVVEVPQVESVPEVKQKPFVLRFKQGNHAAENVTIQARDKDFAEKVGRKWCEMQGNGLTPYRFISVSDPVVADESILG